MRPERLPCGPLTPRSAESLYRQLEELSKQSWFTATYPVILDLTWAGWVISLDVGNGASTAEFPWYEDANGKLTTDYDINLRFPLVSNPNSTTAVLFKLVPAANTNTNAFEITKPGVPGVPSIVGKVTNTESIWKTLDPAAPANTGAENRKTVTNNTVTDLYLLAGYPNTPALYMVTTNNNVTTQYALPNVPNTPTLNMGITPNQSNILLTGLGPNNPALYMLTNNTTDYMLFNWPNVANTPLLNMGITNNQSQLYLLGSGPNPSNIAITSTNNTSYMLFNWPNVANSPVLNMAVTNNQSQLYMLGPNANAANVATTVDDTKVLYEMLGPNNATSNIADEVTEDWAQSKITAGAAQDRPLWLLEATDGTDKVWVDDGFQMHAKASDTASASLNLGPGTAPTSPANGDIWVTAASIFARVNGTTYDLLTGSAGPGGADTEIQFNDGGVFGGVSGLTWDKVAEKLTMIGGVSGTNTNIIGATITLDGSAGGGDAIQISADGATGITTTTSDLELTAGNSFGVKVGTSSTNLVGLWGASPVAQYSTTGTTTGFTAGSGTAANDDSTYTGNTGSTAYTVGDIVKALKLAGIMAT